MPSWNLDCKEVVELFLCLSFYYIYFYFTIINSFTIILTAVAFAEASQYRIPEAKAYVQDMVVIFQHLFISGI